MPGSSSKDFAATQLLADVLSSQRGSLYALVPEGKALYAGFQLSDLPEAGLGYAIGVFPQGASGDDMINEIKKILADDVKNGLPTELIEAVRRHEIVDAEFERNSVSGLAMEWSTAVAIEGRESPDADIEAVKKVTAEDVSRVAREFLNPDAAITAVLTPQPSGKAVSSSAFGGQESLASKPTHDVTAAGLGGQGHQPADRAGIERSPRGEHAAQRDQADYPTGIGEQYGQRLGRN